MDKHRDDIGIGDRGYMKRLASCHVGCYSLVALLAGSGIAVQIITWAIFNRLRSLN